MATRAVTLALLASCFLAAQSGPPSDTEQANPAAAIPESPPLVNCPAGSPLGAVDLRVESPRGGEQPLPFRTINHLSEGDTVLYAPILRGKEKRSGEIALVLVPEKRQSGEENIIVTDPKPAEKPQRWTMSQTISLAAFVYGPAGLNRKKVAKFLTQDELLVAQLADYADKTAQAEALVTALSNAESSPESINAALNGFASQYGFAVQLDKSAPPAAQAEALFMTMNPQLATYNPLASSRASSIGQTASLATAAATLFFGSPIGLAAGGTAMLLDLRSIAFPDTQFRASFAQPFQKMGVNLCGQQGPLPPHTRVAFIWASRIPNAPTPAIRIGNADYVPATQKSPVPVDVSEPTWKYLQRARDWTLANDKQRLPVQVLKLGNQKALEIDLTKGNVAPGDYRLAGYWDWAPFEANGQIHVLSLSDFKKAQLEPASQDRLLADSGKVPVTLAGSDFEFTTKVEMKKANDEFATEEPVRFVLPKGLREGPQHRMDLQIDTHELEPGSYELLISQQDGKNHPVSFKVLPNPPRIDNLPIVANQGVAAQHYVLKGERLALLARLEAPDVSFDLGPANPAGNERNLTVMFKSSPQPGTKLPIQAYLEDRSEPLTLPDAIQVTGPLPVIASTKLSLPAGMSIAVRPDELPAGMTLTAMLDVKNIERKSVLNLGCSDDIEETTSLRVGQQTANSNLQQLSQDQLFLAFDTSMLPAGCTLQAVIDNGRDGRSQPFTLARVIRVPQVEAFTLSSSTLQNGARQYLLTGSNLEMIEKLGWDESEGTAVSGLPTPLPGPGQKQSLQINLPDPPKPDSYLYVWLRGDAKGRLTTIRAPAIPVAAPAPIGPPAPSGPLSSMPPPPEIPGPILSPPAVSPSTPGIVPGPPKALPPPPKAS